MTTQIEQNGNIPILITDEDKFLENADSDVSTEGCHYMDYGGSLCIKGTVTIGDESITGEHGLSDYEEEYGFKFLDPYA
ncbi:MAG TPA: hypothetical protein VLA13_06810 [Massilibacterium sp.]|nr:hypothetical protein [Massilibacterium sp.]